MTLEEVQAKFEHDRFATENGAIVTEIGDGYACCEMSIQPKHLNANNVIMGGAIFTLADFAFAVASNHGATSAVSLNSQISFISAGRGSKLFAKSERIKEGRTTCYYQTTVTDENNKLIAHVTTNGFITSK